MRSDLAKTPETWHFYRLFELFTPSRVEPDALKPLGAAFLEWGYLMTASSCGNARAAANRGPFGYD